MHYMDFCSCTKEKNLVFALYSAVVDIKGSGSQKERIRNGGKKALSFPKKTLLKFFS